MNQNNLTLSIDPALEPSIKLAMSVKELVSPSLAKAAVQFAQHAK